MAGLAMTDGDSIVVVGLMAALGAFVGSAVSNAPPKANP